jgi:hypothetical protein
MHRTQLKKKKKDFFHAAGAKPREKPAAANGDGLSQGASYRSDPECQHQQRA